MTTSESFIRFTSSIGIISIYGSSAGISQVNLDEKPNELHFDEQTSLFLLEARRQILQYLEGDRVAFDIPLNWESITYFQKDVLQLTRDIPFGDVRTYGQIAALLHKPRAARAVGAALARNPMPILIPCHRVVAADGHLTGYLGSKGISTKQRLLEREGHRIVGQKLG